MHWLAREAAATLWNSGIMIRLLLGTLARIDRRDYMLPFSTDGRRLVKVGVNFSPISEPSMNGLSWRNRQ